MACFATPYGLRCAAHCFNRADAQNNRPALIPAGGKLGVTSDGIKGLKGKLEASDRGSAYLKALRKKEAFAKLLEDWRSFPSAQEIIAYFLSRIDSCFEAHIEPLLGIASNDEIDRAIDRHLVQPVLEEMGTGPFMLNSTHVNGMIYWLAEQCYVRWHQ